MMRQAKSIGMFLIAVLCFSAVPNTAKAQFKPLTISLEKDSAGKDLRSLRFVIWAQPQVVFPLTANAGGSTATADAFGNMQFVMRRARFMTLAQISPDDYMVFHIGINNQTTFSGGLTVSGGTEATGLGKKTQLFIHDFTYDRRVAYGDWGSFYLGGGIHYWNGISRAATASTISISTLDIPLQFDPFLETADQFARKFGFYTKGMLGSLAYNVAFNFPFQPAAGTAASAINGTGTVLTEGIATYNKNAYGKVIEGYFAWQFLDKESVVLPFKAGTYLGAKNVFNVGAGFSTYLDGMYYKKGGVEQRVTTLAVGVDVFGDLMLGEKASAGVLNFYGLYNYNNLGPNYYRPLSSDAIGDIGLIATGHSFMVNLQYITGSYLPTKFGIYAQFIGVMPTFDKTLLTGAVLETYKNRPEFWNNIEAGINWYAIGHNLRITVAYRSCVLYEGNEGKRADKAFAQFAFSI